ncbi:hypothetical protein KL86DPRO_20521 [uncultured delta proteobacterium]|uniref:Uncharacterized protein n=1 Tax=uncultured delta proteobacterium TaxID=34034 RepID=A0A212K1J7_9DELT|nr:hypothetical protein KL86DPRO_20521 [uncultured delta proteobacterium]
MIIIIMSYNDIVKNNVFTIKFIYMANDCIAC